MPLSPFEHLETHTRYVGHVIRVDSEQVALPHDGGRRIALDVLRHPGAAAVVALDAEGRVLLVRQWRQPMATMTWELPAGTAERGEPPLVTATRELAEEAGARAERWQQLGEIWPSPGFSDERVALFLARSLTLGKTAFDANEDLELARVPLDEALERVRGGELRDAKTAVGLMWARAAVDGEAAAGASGQR